MIRDHWTKFLNEFNRHFLVDSIMTARSRAERARQEAERFDREAAQYEAELLPDIRRNWTESEIQEAKHDADTYGTWQEKIRFLNHASRL